MNNLGWSMGTELFVLAGSIDEMNRWAKEQYLNQYSRYYVGDIHRLDGLKVDRAVIVILEGFWHRLNITDEERAEQVQLLKQVESWKAAGVYVMEPYVV